MAVPIVWMLGSISACVKSVPKGKQMCSFFPSNKWHQLVRTRAIVSQLWGGHKKVERREVDQRPLGQELGCGQSGDTEPRVLVLERDGLMCLYWRHENWWWCTTDTYVEIILKQQQDQQFYIYNFNDVTWKRSTENSCGETCVECHVKVNSWNIITPNLKIVNLRHGQHLLLTLFFKGKDLTVIKSA